MKHRNLQLARTTRADSRFLTADEERALFAAHAKGDARAKERIIRGVMSMARAMSARWSELHRRDRDDMDQAAYTGLVVAFNRYDVSRGVRFSTYAMEWVRHELNDLLGKRRLVGPGRVTQAEHAVIRGELAKGLSAAEVSAKLRVRMSTIQSAVESETYAVAGGDYVDYLAGGRSQHDLLEQRRSVERVQRWLGSLDDRERDVISRCVVADDREDRASVARGYGLSRERVRQVELEALEKLRRRVSGERRRAV